MALTPELALTPESRLYQLKPSHMAMWLTVKGKGSIALVKLPPAYTALAVAANTLTLESKPKPRFHQFAPSQRAMLLTLIPPTLVNVPPTNTSLPRPAIASTRF